MIRKNQMAKKKEIGVIIFLAILLLLNFNIGTVYASSPPFTRLVGQNQTNYNTPTPYSVWTNASQAANCNAWKAFDNNTAGAAGCANNADGDVQFNNLPGVFIGFDLGSGNATIIDSFNLTITLYAGSRNFDPTAIKVEGSNDNSSYTNLGIAAYGGIGTTNSVGAKIQMNYTNTVAYRYYRYTIVSVAGGNATATIVFSEITPLRGSPTSPAPPYLTIAVNDTRLNTSFAQYNYSYTTTNGSDPGPFTGQVTNTTWPLTNYSGTINITFTNISSGNVFNTTITNLVFGTTALNAYGLTWQNFLQLGINDTITGATILGFNITITNGTNTNSYYTTAPITIYNLIGNLTFSWWNITGNYFNVTQTINNFNTTQTIINTTTQGRINISAYRLFLNISISTFNTTNNVTNNQTTNGYILLPAVNGSNNIQVQVGGNYSKNITCIIPQPLSTVFCNATGIYDANFTIGATANGAGINNFSITVVNNTLGTPSLYNQNTTNGSIVFQLLQGYYYFFNISTNNLSSTNTTQLSNNNSGSYNFTLLSYNTFEINFFNESTDNKLTGNGTITVQIIGSSFAANYTTNNNTVFASLLTPDNYTIRYWLDPLVPREYYAQLVQNSYNNLTLYVLDASISTLYLPVIKNDNIQPLSGATIQLMRDYIENGVDIYRVVEMTKSDTNGQGTLRVVPNTINYKLLITSGTFSITTTPTKFTASTNSYTLNLHDTILSSLSRMPSVSKSFTFINSSLTYVFTWTDTQSLVTQGCMIINKQSTTGTYIVYNTCSTGSTGSLIYTITDTNNTAYSGEATLYTNTQFSTYGFGPVSASFINSPGSTFGLIGMILLLVFVVFIGIMANESGSDGMIIISILGLIGFGLFGIIAYQWEAFIGFIIFGVILIYKTRS